VIDVVMSPMDIARMRCGIGERLSVNEGMKDAMGIIVMPKKVVPVRLPETVVVVLSDKPLRVRILSKSACAQLHQIQSRLLPLDPNPLVESGPEKVVTGKED
jgi:hypothetical protein